MLRDPGENKFNALQNELAQALTRTIRKQRESFQDSSDALLAMQLSDYVNTWLCAKWVGKYK
jgi:hypothetical protein